MAVLTLALDGSDPTQAEALLSRSQLGSRAAPLWTKLQQLLMQYEGLTGEGSGLRLHSNRLRVAVAEAILRTDRRVGLPPWLLQLFLVSG